MDLVSAQSSILTSNLGDTSLCRSGVPQRFFFRNSRLVPLRLASWKARSEETGCPQGPEYGVGGVRQGGGHG